MPDLEAGRIAWVIQRFRGNLSGTKVSQYSDHEALDSIGKVEDYNARVQRTIKFRPGFDCTLEHRTSSGDGKTGFLSRLWNPAIEHDHGGSSSLTPVEDGDILLVRACGFRTRSSPTPGVGLWGLVPRTQSAVLSGLPFTFSDFPDFRAHGPRMRIDDPSAPSERFVARVSASFSTIDPRPSLSFFSPTANDAFASVFVVPSAGDMGHAEASAAATTVAQNAPLPKSVLQVEYYAVITDAAASLPPVNPPPLNIFPPSGRISTRTRQRTVAAADTAPRAVEYGSGPLDHPSGVLSPHRAPHGRNRPYPSSRPRLLPPCRSRWYPSHPTATAPSSWGFLVYGLHSQLTHLQSLRPISTASAQLLNFSSAIPQGALLTPTGL